MAGLRQPRTMSHALHRHYGRPADNVHAIQLEMTQCSYMQEALPFDYLPDVAGQVQPHVRRMVEAALAFAKSRA